MKLDEKEREWVGTVQLESVGIPRYTAYRWRHELARKGWARHVTSGLGGRGLWLFSPEAVAFLRSRKGKRGRPAGRKGE